MQCSVCGKQLNGHYDYCPNCGRNINDGKIDNIINYSKKNTKLKCCMFVILVVLFFVSCYYVIFGVNANLSEYGRWKCTEYNGELSINNEDNYFFELVFNEDNTFKQISLDSTKSNINIFGTYTKKVSKKVYEGTSGCLDLYLSAEDGSTNHYEFSKIKGIKKEALVINTNSYSAYICKKY